ncbi:MAG TPA: D-glycero-beta-D-manno-heptose 1-phosphate adenylyltransferase, partial [Desulfobacterales bacterium]|nr:D-glycero-beta-D-manno-heptose 1-phosphate adenylyltransferase [Desulfobacterales bacterium]
GTVVVLPELWATGFACDRVDEMAALTPGLLKEMRCLAADYNILLAGSFMEAEEGLYNTLFVCGTAGVCGRYRKQQLFEPTAEDNYFQPGNNPLPVDTPQGPLGALICYDLRFPELAAAQVRQGAGLLVAAAQWPASRLEHWRALLRARAIENQVFVAAANCSGSAGGIDFGGHSMVIAPDGTVLIEAGAGEEAAVVDLDAGRLRRLRADFNTAAPTPYRFSDGNKIHSAADLSSKFKDLRAAGRRLVFTNGCFDILHPGHVTYLEEARRQGDCLVVGLNSDASVRAIKGPARPINDENSRARVLAALGCVDYVTIFNEETPLTLIKLLRPQILVKGADWSVDSIVGGKEVIAWGGEVINIPLVAGCSTTSVIERIRESAGHDI